MSKQILVVLAALLVTFGCGLAVGLHLGSALPEEQARADGATSGTFAASGPAQGDVQRNTLLSSRIRELETQLAKQKQDEQTAVAGQIAFFKKYHDALRLSPLEGNRQLSPEMAEVLGLSPEEKKAVDQRLAATDDALTKLANADQFLAKQDANGITIETPADPKGKEIRDELVDSLNANIGEDRANFLMSYLGDNSGEPLGGFAQAKADLEITWANQNGKLMYTVKHQFYDPKGNENSAYWSSMPTLPAEDEKYFSSDSAAP